MGMGGYCNVKKYLLADVSQTFQSAGRGGARLVLRRSEFRGTEAHTPKLPKGVTRNPRLQFALLSISSIAGKKTFANCASYALLG